MSCLVVCQAGGPMGLGHLTRSLVAARALTETLGASVRFIVQGEALQCPDLDAFAHRWVGRDADLVGAVEDVLRDDAVRVVVFDLAPSHVPADFVPLLDDLRRRGCKLVSIDGLASLRDRLDLLFIPSFRSGGAESRPGGGTVRSGWDCYLLDTRTAPRRWQPGNRVLVLTGGSDVARLGETLPALLDSALPKGTELHWVVGPFAPAPREPLSPRLRLIAHHSLSGLDQLMLSSNYALTVFGVSFFELLRLGIPAVVFSPYGDRDREDLAGMVNAAVAAVANSATDAVARLVSLMADDTMARRLSTQAAGRVDGSGGRVFAATVREMLIP